MHLILSVSPHLSVSGLVKELKGKSSWKVLSEFKSLSRQYWVRYFWVRGYFVESSGNVTDEVIMEYIKNQDVEKESDDDFKISDS
nr:IS200/IS605 family transposase [Echinicola strongylocentroti]